MSKYVDIKLTLTNGDTVVSEVDARDIQQVVDTIFGGEFFVDETDNKCVIIPKEKIVKVEARF